MPVGIIATLIPKLNPGEYYFHILISILVVAATRTYAQGRITNRERDLHGRVILLTGGFTSTGLTLTEALVQRGANIISLTPDAIDSPHITLVIEALRELARNERIFAEQCDIHSIESVRAFCTKFLTGNDHRLDAIIFAHEYEHIGPLFASREGKQACDDRRAAASDGTFLMTTLLLPTLLVAPPERDIRIINVVNPFYAAALPFFPDLPSKSSQFVREGYRALRSVVFTRHLQRVFDALPSAPALNPDTASASLASTKAQKSNIVSVSVSPGFSRHDTLAPILRANYKTSEFSIVGFIIYIVLQPLLRIFAKTPTHAIQSILHVLFLPTPFKHAEKIVSSEEKKKNQDNDISSEELLKPGALYSDCSIVRISVRGRDGSDKGKDKGSTAADDGELGGEELGRLVWESYEDALKHREKATTSQSSEPSNKKKD